MCDMQETTIFLHHKNLPSADNFFNLQWLAHLALLTDITMHLSGINVKLKGKNILVTDMYSHITLEVKLCLRKVQLAAGQFMHFPHFAACASDDVDLNTCVSAVTSLQEEFASHFTGLRPLAPVFKLFTSPFNCPVDKALVPPTD